MNRKRTIRESLADKNYVMGIYNKMSESERIKWRKAVKECLEENPSLKSNVNFYKFMTGFGIILLIVAFATGGYALAALPALGAFGMAMDERTFNQLRKCVRAKIELSDETEEDLPPSEDKPIEESKRKKVIRMTESELIRLVKKVIKEQSEMAVGPEPVKECLIANGLDPDTFTACKAAYKNPNMTTVMACLTELGTKVSFQKVVNVGKCIKQKTNLPIMY